jgi:hypothetical protein
LSRKPQPQQAQQKRPKSDATFFRDGTYTEHAYWGAAQAWWWRLAGWKKKAPWVLFVALTWAFATHPLATAWVLALIGGPAAGLGVVWAEMRRLQWKHYRTRVRPLHYALAPVLRLPPATRPQTYLTVPVDYATNLDAAIEIQLPQDFTGGDGEKTEISRAVDVKLGIEAPDAEWKLLGRQPHVKFTRSEPSPDRVPFSAIAGVVKDANPHEVIIGLGKKAQVIKVSVDNDSPHVGLTMTSGDGKSTIAKNVGAQMLYHGCIVMVLDCKLISHMWARGLPNVSYAGTPAEIEAAMVWLAGEVARRNEVTLAGADVEGEVHADVGPRILVIAEELNATQDLLRAWWNDEMGRKGRSPGSKALDRVMFMGRQVHINVLQIGQRLSVRASGSGDARVNLGVLIFADPEPSTWKMLVGDRHLLPAASGHLGRLQVVTRKEVRETQGAYLTGRQARDFALAGTIAVPRLDMPCVTRVSGVPPGKELALVGSDEPMSVGRPTPGPPTVTLREAVNAGLFPSVDAVRKRQQRDETFPRPVGSRNSAHLFDLNDLYAYLAAKSLVTR